MQALQVDNVSHYTSPNAVMAGLSIPFWGNHSKATGTLTPIEEKKVIVRLRSLEWNNVTEVLRCYKRDEALVKRWLLTALEMEESEINGIWNVEEIGNNGRSYYLHREGEHGSTTQMNVHLNLLGGWDSLLPSEEQQERAIRHLQEVFESKHHNALAEHGIEPVTFNNLRTLSEWLVEGREFLSNLMISALADWVVAFGRVRNSPFDSRGADAVGKCAANYFFARDVMSRHGELKGQNFEDIDNKLISALKAASVDDVQSLFFILQQCGGAQ